MADKIILKGLEFYGYHGVLSEERSLGQRFIIDLELSVSLLEAGITDNLNKTINYAEVFQTVQEIVTGQRYSLIEALAEKIAAVLIKNFPVSGVKVKVRKPQAPIPGIFKYAAVEIYREAHK